MRIALSFMLRNLRVQLKKARSNAVINIVVSFSFSPTSQKYQFHSVTSGFTRLSMKAKYVYHSLISLYAQFDINPTK